MEQLEARIRLEASRLDPVMLRKACQDFRSRCRKVIAANGGFIE